MANPNTTEPFEVQKVLKKLPLRGVLAKWVLVCRQRGDLRHRSILRNDLMRKPRGRLQELHSLSGRSISIWTKPDQSANTTLINFA